ncbi:MAG: hypothetical protein ACXVXT_01200 [Blastococcus sp.]
MAAAPPVLFSRGLWLPEGSSTPWAGPAARWGTHAAAEAARAGADALPHA